jgi:rhodanese-related sulfurtransferase
MSIQTIEPRAVQAMRDRGEAVDIIDVRTPAEFDAVHATDATLIPLDRISAADVRAKRRTGAEKPVFVICKSGQRAAKAAEKLQAEGMANVVSIAGGTSAWEGAGLPVVRGASKVIPLERQVRIGAGILVLTGVILGWRIHPAFYGLSAFVGAGLLFAGITDWCGMGMLLAKMPWNQRGG